MPAQLIVLIIILVTIIFALTIPKYLWKFVWIIPTLISSLILLYGSTLHGEEQMVLIFLYPIILLCVIFLLAYYLKILYFFLNNFCIKTRITVWTITISVILAVTSWYYLEGYLKPYREAHKEVDQIYMHYYKDSHLIAYKLEDYHFPSVSPNDNQNVLKFNSIKIAPPFKFNKNQIIRKKHTMIVESIYPQEKHSLSTFIIYDENVITEGFPPMQDKNLEILAHKTVRFPRTTYSERLGAFNKVPTFESDGSINHDDMQSPEISFKKEIEYAYRFMLLEDLKVKRILFHKESIKGFLYQGTLKGNKVKFAEIYENNKLEFTIILQEKNFNYQDFDRILASVENGL